MKRIIIISSSLRAGSNSEILARSFEKGATDSGNTVQYISLKNKHIEFCKGCLACQKNHRCVIKDDVEEIINEVKKSDVVVFSTPIYYYEMSGLLKTLLDRMNPIYGSDYRFREVYVIATAADEDNHAFDRAYNGISGWVECFEDVELKGIIRGGGISEPLEANKHQDKIKESYDLGRSI
ncbi:MAG: flavodoxin family protein [Bacilli bacterium]